MAEKLKLVNDLKTNDDNDETKRKIAEIENRLSELLSKKNRDKVMDNFKNLDGTNGDSFNNGVWNITKKVFPKHQQSQPVAMKDISGKLVTSKEEIKKLYIETFSFRLRDRPSKDGYQNIHMMEKELCQKRLEITKNNKSPEWNFEDLEKSLSN